MKLVVGKKGKGRSIKVLNQVPCPICRQVYSVNNVTSARRQGGNIVYRKYCKNCLMEFDRDGTIIQPLY